MRHHETPTSCRCDLPEGHWGAGGYHFRYSSTADLVRREIWHRAQTDGHVMMLIRGAMARSLRPAETAELEELKRQVEIDSQAAIEAATGKAWAYERCAESRWQAEQAIAARKRQERESKDEHFET